MRLMLACAAAVAAVAFAAPSFAQEAAPAAAPMTAPTKPKVGTTAYCNSLKSTSSKAACLKRLHASAAKPASVRKAKGKKPATDAMAAPKETSAQYSAPAVAPVQQAEPSTIAVPPLPQKTI